MPTSDALLRSPRLRVTVAGHVCEGGVTLYLVCDASGVTRARRSLDDFRQLHACIRLELQLQLHHFPVRERLIRYPRRTRSKAIVLDHYVRTVWARAKERGHLPLLDFIGAPMLLADDVDQPAEASPWLGRTGARNSSRFVGRRTSHGVARAAGTYKSDSGWLGSVWASLAVSVRHCAGSIGMDNLPVSSARGPRSSLTTSPPTVQQMQTRRPAGHGGRRFPRPLVAPNPLSRLASKVASTSSGTISGSPGHSSASRSRHTASQCRGDRTGVAAGTRSRGGPRCLHRRQKLWRPVQQMPLPRDTHVARMHADYSRTKAEGARGLNCYGRTATAHPARLRQGGFAELAT
jgi:hypothetical protein